MKRPLLLCGLAAVLPAYAQVQLDPVVISVERTRQTTFDAPAAISAVSRDVIEAGGPQVNLSEALNRVPGIAILNRQNYAQDLQLSIRGFGSRSTFGIRGVRLIVDGIPATMPDGQGQASNIALGSASRIEVLRGPMAQLYGNAAGGVVQVFTDMEAREPTTTVSLAVGPYDQVRPAVRFAAGGETDAVSLEASHYRTDGWREHSEASRDIVNAKWQHDAGRDTRISVVANMFDQPLALDPAGLERKDWEADPRQALPIVVSQDARKTVQQEQIGVVLEHAPSPATNLTARVYFGDRHLDNALSTPPSFQASNTSSGGIVRFSRSYTGLGVQLAHNVPLGEGRALRLTGGIEADRLEEDRQGYVNNAGVAGALKRDEHNVIDDRDAYAQVAFDLTPAWTATAGLRASRVEFRTTDFFIKAGTPNNGDDSGSVAYSATNPVVGLSFRAAPTLNLYANAGRGFETPTGTELAYRPAPAAGLNFELRAAHSRHAEVGAKWKISAQQRLDAAIFDIRTSDEIVVDTNTGGRTTYKNAGPTSRRGIEVQYLGQLGADLSATLSLTALRAHFDDDAANGAAAGKSLPGTPDRTVFAELVWTPAQRLAGFHAAAELVHTGKLWVNDTNDDAAAAVTVLNLRAGLRQTAGAWTFTQLLRVDNATDRVYAGSVIVNESNRRYFESALPRNWLLALSASYATR